MGFFRGFFGFFWVGFLLPTLPHAPYGSKSQWNRTGTGYGKYDKTGGLYSELIDYTVPTYLFYIYLAKEKKKSGSGRQEIIARKEIQKV